jgi:hypothetical protein
MILFVGILFLGEILVSRMDFPGPLRGFETVIGEEILQRYDKVAIFCLLSSWGLAIKSYLRDRKRFW